MLSRSFLPAEEQSSLLAYTPMFHARLFAQEASYRRTHFQSTKPDESTEPWLDGNPKLDRPLFVQFCANDPEHLLSAAKHVAPHCDAVDLNLGCPQGIARKGHYGSFLQEDQDLIYRLINKLHKELDVPVTAKIRVLETKEKTLEYAKNVLSAGASILTVHGRRREQKGHLTGVADWSFIRYLRDNLPPETVMFANGNILQGDDVQKCIDATGVDGVMSAEGNLSDPAIFGRPPKDGEEGREYWRGKDGKGGWRVDAVTRRYLDLLHRYAEGSTPPQRKPLFVPGDDTAWLDEDPASAEEDGQPPAKKRRKDAKAAESNPNLTGVQGHMFHLLRHFVSKHTDIRDQLAKAGRQGLPAFEAVLSMMERRVASGMLEYERTGGKSWEDEISDLMSKEDGVEGESSTGTMKRCKRPWWVVQPIIRPLPKEALEKGALSLSKKDKKKVAGDKPEGKAAAEEVKPQEKTEGSVKEIQDEKTEEKEAGEGAAKTETQKDLEARDNLVSG